MKFTLGVAILTTVQLFGTAVAKSCPNETIYARTRPNSVSTYFYTETLNIWRTTVTTTSTISAAGGITFTDTRYVHEVTVHRTYDYGSTWWETVAPTTTTVPRLPKFTPMVSAPNGTIYPVFVQGTCVVTKTFPTSYSTVYAGHAPTHTVTDSKSTTTTYIDTFLTPVTTSTIHTSTATAYEACQTNNLIQKSRHELIDHPIYPVYRWLFVTVGGPETPDSGVSLNDPADMRAGYQSPEDCCNTFFNMYYHGNVAAIGFSWYTDGTHFGGQCVGNIGDVSGPTASNPAPWAFLTGPDDANSRGDYHLGNGPIGAPFWAGFTTSSTSGLPPTFGSGSSS